MRLAEFRAKWNRLNDFSEGIQQPADLSHSVFPDDAQLDLIKAAMLPAAEAAPAWRRWKERGIPLETVDLASRRLFSQLFTNRSAAGIDTEDLPLLKAVYQGTLARNTLILRAALEAARVLTDADISVLFIKGAATIAISGGRPGLRTIADVDVLVPETEAERAVTLLRAAGYMPQCDTPIGQNHGFSVKRSDGAALDLHWWAFKTAGDDRGIFDTAREATILNHTVLIPSATDCLAMTVANAFRNMGSPLRWISDAILVFAIEGDKIDWDLLLERAKRRGLTAGLAAGLDFLTREFGIPVPVQVLTCLRGQRLGWLERTAHWAAVTKPRSAGMIEALELLRARRLDHRIGWSHYFLDSTKTVLRGVKAVLRGVVKRFLQHVQQIRNPGLRSAEAIHR
jgi:hypothetical protein